MSHHVAPASASRPSRVITAIALCTWTPGLFASSAAQLGSAPLSLAQVKNVKTLRSQRSGHHPRTQIQITCTHRARLKPLRSPAHAAEDHMYTPASPRSHVHTSEIICARRFRSHVHTSTLRPRSHVDTTTLTL